MKTGIRVEVVYALAERQALLTVVVPAGTSMLEAARRSGIVALFPGLQLEQAAMGIFGKRVDDPASREVHEGERVEIYRPLTLDPKTARRARARRTREQRS